MMQRSYAVEYEWESPLPYPLMMMRSSFNDAFKSPIMRVCVSVSVTFDQFLKDQVLRQVCLRIVIWVLIPESFGESNREQPKICGDKDIVRRLRIRWMSHENILTHCHSTGQ